MAAARHARWHGAAATVRAGEDAGAATETRRYVAGNPLGQRRLCRCAVLSPPEARQALQVLHGGHKIGLHLQASATPHTSAIHARACLRLGKDMLACTVWLTVVAGLGCSRPAGARGAAGDSIEGDSVRAAAAPVADPLQTPATQTPLPSPAYPTGPLTRERTVGEFRFRADARVVGRALEDTLKVALAATNLSPNARELTYGSGCNIRMLARPGSGGGHEAETVPPAWDSLRRLSPYTPVPVVCAGQGRWVDLPAEGSTELVFRYPVREILGDSLPPGVYRFALIISNLNDDTVALSAGSARLGR